MASSLVLNLLMFVKVQDYFVVNYNISLPGITFATVNVPSPSSTMYFFMCFDDTFL